MALQKVQFLPGFNKQITETQAEGQWVDGDNVRFRYGTPEKIGGWQQLGENQITGAARAMHHIVTRGGVKYSIIGTNRILYAYSGGIFYDIHPIESTTTLTNAFSTTNGSPTVTITFSSGHGLAPGDIILLDNFTAITGSDFTASDFDDKKFMVSTTPTNLTITITMPSNETGAGATTSGGIRVQSYYSVGPAEQLPGFGYGLGSWGGEASNPLTTTLNGAINDTTTTVVLTSVVNFPSTGTNYIRIGSEDISFPSKVIDPLSIGWVPTMELNKVVLPDPLGPMIPVIVPLLTLIEQSETAANPPKYLLKLLISKILSDI